jgi:hypothetical protein
VTSRRIFALLAACTLSSCVSFASPENRFISPDYAGMNIHQWKKADNAVYRDMGITWLRLTFNGSEIEREEGLWNFSRLDELVDGIGAAGGKVLAILAYETPWLYPDGKVKRKISAENLPHFLRFVETTVEHYRGRVAAWEIWNEPNWIFWEGSDAEFFELSKAAAGKIRQTDPQAVIIAGSFNRVPASFIRKMFAYGAMDQVDAVSFHPYDTGPSGMMRLYDKFEKILLGSGYRGKIWVTETGYPTGGWYPTAVREDLFPSYIVKTFAGLAVRGAETCFWYELFDSYNRDEAPSSFDSENFFGVLYPDYTPKNAAFALCARYIAGKEYRPGFPVRDQIPKTVESLFFAGADGNHTLVLWNKGSGTVKTELQLPSRTGVIYDIASGEGRETAGKMSLSIGSIPQIITWTSPDNGLSVSALYLSRVFR